MQFAKQKRMSFLLTLSDYLASREKPELKGDIDLYVFGLGRGVFWTEVAFEHKKRGKLFCLPEKLEINESMVTSLLDQEISKPVDGNAYAQDTDVGLIMVKSFVGRFPCGH